MSDTLTSSANYYCTWPNCDYVQQGKRDIFKAKRHVWDKHLKKVETFQSWIFEKKGQNGPPGYGNMTQEERERVNEEILKYLSEQDPNHNRRELQQQWKHIKELYNLIERNIIIDQFDESVFPDYSKFCIERIEPSIGPLEGNQRVLISGKFTFTPKDEIALKFGNFVVGNIETVLENKIYCKTPRANRPCTVPIILNVQGKNVKTMANYTFLETDEYVKYLRNREFNPSHLETDHFNQQENNSNQNASYATKIINFPNMEKVFGFSEFHKYACFGENEKLKNLLCRMTWVQKEQAMRKCDHFGRTPIYYACLYDHQETITLLLNHGAVLSDLSILGSNEKTNCPLKVMKKETFLKVVSWLKEQLMYILSRIKSVESPEKTFDSSQVSSIKIIGGTQKEKYGINYWVQRNVVSIQIVTSFMFDVCRVSCRKDGCSEVRLMVSLPFLDRFFKNQNTNLFQATFKKKLPYTSGRPETQKEIWLIAEFYRNEALIHTVTSEKFYVCSRPFNEKKVITTVKRKKENPTLTLYSRQEQIPPPQKDFQLQSVPQIIRHEYRIPHQMNHQKLQSNYDKNHIHSMGRVDLVHMQSYVPNQLNERNCFEGKETLVQMFNQNSSITSKFFDIYPSYGHLEGGMRVTISGIFDVQSINHSLNDLMIYFGLIPSVCEYVDRTKIVCYVPSRLIPGKVKVSGMLRGKAIMNELEFTYIEKEVIEPPAKKYKFIYNGQEVNPVCCQVKQDVIEYKVPNNINFDKWK